MNRCELPWFRTFMLEDHTPGFFPLDKLDEAYLGEIIELYKKGNVDSVSITSKCHWGYSHHPTKIGYVHPNLKVDFVGGLVKLAHENNIKPYSDFSVGYDNIVVLKNPDWSIRDKGGNMIRSNPTPPFPLWYQPCFNSPYHDYCLEQLEELAENYEVEGVFIDGLRWIGYCYCDWCKTKYETERGRKLPDEPRWDREWKEYITWRDDTLMKFWGEIISIIKKHRPKIPIFRNYYASSFRSWSGGQRSYLIGGEDLVFGEGTAPDRSVFLRGIAGGKPFTLVPSTGPPQSTKVNTHGCKLWATSILAQGGAVTIYSRTQYPDGTLDKAYYTRMLGPAYAEVAKRQDYIQGSMPITYAAVLYSDQTRIYYGRDNQIARYGTSLGGALRMISDLHVPYEMLPEWRLSPETLDEFKVVILPNVACLTEDRVDVLEKYVKNGGQVVATFDTSLYDWEGEFLGEFQLRKVFGLTYLRHHDDGYNDFGSYLASGDHQIVQNLPKTVLAMPGPFIVVKPLSGETVGWHVLPVCARSSDRWANYGTIPGRRTEYPAVHINNFGRGRAIYTTAELFRIFEKGELWPRQFMGDVINWLAPDPPMYVEAPATVEATFFNQAGKNRFTVHLVNCTSYEELIPVRDIKIWIRKDIGKPRNIFVAPEKQKLQITEEEKYTLVTIPETKLHEIVVLEK